MKRAIAFLVKLILKTRYRITVCSNLKKSKLQSTLILPNHPAEIDPVIISTELWPILKPRPVVLETVVDMPGFKQIFNYIGAISMPDMEQGSGFYKRKRIKNTLDNIVSALHEGDNILIYPSGRLSVNGKEILAAASGAYTIIQQLQTARVVLVRTRGLWGSRFSKAQSGGARPDIVKGAISSIKTIFKNFIFLVPKRKVEMFIEEFSLEELKSKSLTDLNAFLENWYAQGGEDNVQFISDSFLSKGAIEAPVISSKEEAPVFLEEGKRNKIIAHLVKVSEKPSDQIAPEMKLADDLGLDSLAVAELLSWLHDELDCSDLELAELITVNSVFRAAAKEHVTKVEGKIPAPPAAWIDTVSTRPIPCLKSGNSVAEAFILSAKTYKSQPACYDPRLGVKSYQDLLVSSLVLRNHVQALPGEYIGVLLPASAVASMVTFAILLAKKTPVFLNWTAGSRSLQHSVDSLAIQKIITAGTVLDTINQDLSALDDRFLLLEELKPKNTLALKLKSLCESYLPAARLIKYLELNEIKPEQSAAVLFTSGSEAAPKGVPLSNKNILANIRSITEIFNFSNEDVVYAFLPPFHSFGLTVTSFMPLLCGIRVSFYPNPNEGRKIADGCGTWQVSCMAGTPAFIRSILSAGTAKNFTNLRLIMSGADKLGDDVRDLCKQLAPKAKLLEGYGITECSPVVCAQRPTNTNAASNQGVGPPLPNVQLKIVDVNTLTPLKENERGLILISGPNVFPGYIGEAKNPFIEMDGIKWYNSGDLGYLANGCLVISGRLKRFIKIGGEMISLPAIEDALIGKLTKDETSPLIAVVDSEDTETQRPILTVFSNQSDLCKESAQQILKDAGFPALVKLHDVKYLEELPMLGSGKIDIQSLKKIIQQEHAGATH